VYQENGTYMPKRGLFIPANYPRQRAAVLFLPSGIFGNGAVGPVEWVPLAHGAIVHQPDSTRKIDTIPDSASAR